MLGKSPSQMVASSTPPGGKLPLQYAESLPCVHAVVHHRFKQPRHDRIQGGIVDEAAAVVQAEAVLRVGARRLAYGCVKSRSDFSCMTNVRKTCRLS